MWSAEKRAEGLEYMHPKPGSHSGRIVGEPDNESRAANGDSLNFLFARHSLAIAGKRRCRLPCLDSDETSGLFPSGSRRRTTALSSFWCWLAQRHMAVSGPTKVLPSLVREYWTAKGLEFVVRLAISPADSRLRSVRVSIRCEMIPSRRRSSPWRRGLSRSIDKTFGVHFPTKIVEAAFEAERGSCFMSV